MSPLTDARLRELVEVAGTSGPAPHALDLVSALRELQQRRLRELAQRRAAARAAHSDATLHRIGLAIGNVLMRSASGSSRNCTSAVSPSPRLPFDREGYGMSLLFGFICCITALVLLIGIFLERLQWRQERGLAERNRRALVKRSILTCYVSRRRATRRLREHAARSNIRCLLALHGAGERRRPSGRTVLAVSRVAAGVFRAIGTALPFRLKVGKSVGSAAITLGVARRVHPQGKIQQSRLRPYAALDRLVMPWLSLVDCAVRGGCFGEKTGREALTC